MEDLTASLPERLSPSRASTFVQCPRKFYYETIEKMRSPNTIATTKGTLAHYACEHIFDLAREERSVESAVPYVRQHWAELAVTPEYEVIVEMGPATVETMLQEAEQAVANWFKMETPSKFDPTAREEWVLGEIGECKMRGIIDRVDVVQGPESQRVFISDYKGLALDTPLPTPSGWTTMGEVSVGDELFGSDGWPCTVTKKSSVFNRPCYRVVFDDRSSIVCDNEHLWEVNTRLESRPAVWDVEVLSADELYSKWMSGKRPVVIPNADPLQLEDADLPIDPYLLGCWLGDGTSKSGCFTIGAQDVSHFVGSFVVQGETVVERVDKGKSALTVAVLEPRVGICAQDHDPSLWGVNSKGIRRCFACEKDRGPRTNVSLGRRLRDNELLRNKHVPEVYLRGSVAQRLALLQGLMDTDGYFHKKRHQAVFTNTNRNLVEAVYELVCSLGSRAYIFEMAHSRFTKNTAYQVMFTPHEFNPFLLARKAAGVLSSTGRTWRRAIKSIDKVSSVATQCVQVDAPNSLYLAGRQMVPTHNSGRVPKPQYARDSFFAMNIYTELLAQQDKVVADQLRLIYLKNGERSDIKTQDVTAESRAKTVAEVSGIWSRITKAAKSGEFPPKTSPLCNYCHFQSICPAFSGRIF